MPRAPEEEKAFRKEIGQKLVDFFNARLNSLTSLADFENLTDEIRHKIIIDETNPATGNPIPSADLDIFKNVFEYLFEKPDKGINKVWHEAFVASEDIYKKLRTKIGGAYDKLSLSERRERMADVSHQALEGYEKHGRSETEKRALAIALARLDQELIANSDIEKTFDEKSSYMMRTWNAFKKYVAERNSAGGIPDEDDYFDTLHRELGTPLPGGGVWTNPDVRNLFEVGYKVEQLLEQGGADGVWTDDELQDLNRSMVRLAALSSLSTTGSSETELVYQRLKTKQNKILEQLTSRINTGFMEGIAKELEIYDRDEEFRVYAKALNRLVTKIEKLAAAGISLHNLSSSDRTELEKELNAVKSGEEFLTDNNIGKTSREIVEIVHNRAVTRAETILGIQTQELNEIFTDDVKYWLMGNYRSQWRTVQRYWELKKMGNLGLLTQYDVNVLNATAHDFKDAVGRLIEDQEIHEDDAFPLRYLALDIQLNRIQEMLDEKEKADKETVEVGEVIGDFSFYEALREFLEHATGAKGTPPRIVGVGMQESDWRPAMTDAYQNYLDQYEGSSEMEQKFGETMIKVWDYMFKTMNGPHGGVEHIIDEAGSVDNYLVPQDLRELVSFFDIKDFAWIMRDEGVRMLTGVHPVLRNKHGYNNFAETRESFQSDLVEQTLRRMGYDEIDDFIADHPNIPNKAACKLIFDFCYRLNMVTGLIDEGYKLQARKGSSINHTTTRIGGKNLSLANDIVAGAGYPLINTPLTDDPAGMQIVLLSENYLERAYQYVGGVPKKISEYRKAMKLYLEAQLGTKLSREFVGCIDIPEDQPLNGNYAAGPRIFPDLFESIFDQDLYLVSRWLKVDAEGFAFILNNTFEPFPNPLSEEEIFDRYKAFVKNGLGRAKLAKEAFPMDTMLLFFKLYVSRLFRAYDYSTTVGSDKNIEQYFYPAGTKSATWAKFIGRDPRIVSINAMRAKIARDIASGGQSTLKAMGLTGEEASIFRAGALEVLGVKHAEQVIETEEISLRDFAPIPPYLIKIIHIPEIIEYARENIKEGEVGAAGEAWRRFKRLLAGELNPEEALEYLEPPVRAKKQASEKK